MPVLVVEEERIGGEGREEEEEEEGEEEEEHLQVHVCIYTEEYYPMKTVCTHALCQLRGLLSG